MYHWGTLTLKYYSSVSVQGDRIALCTPTPELENKMGEEEVLSEMRSTIQVQKDGLKKIRTIDERLVSYNIEMTEVTGGTFWKAYTPEQIAGTEPFPAADNFSEMTKMMQEYPPVDLYEEKIRKFAKALGPVYIRVSGSWATDTYYDFDGHTGGVVPKGYKSILTKEQWDGVLDFVKEVDAKLLISVSNCKGDHKNGKPWTPEQAKVIFDYSKEYGVPILAAEFMNEPNVFPMNPPAENYGVEAFGQDQDTFFCFIRENYPEVKLVGPCSCADTFDGEKCAAKSALQSVPTEELLDHCKVRGDIFSYHCYAGLSDRGAAIGGHWDAEDALSEAYLNVAAKAAENYGKIRDRYYPGAPMWVTESADAGLGGNTWGSTYMDVIRYADELGRFATITDGIIFHNTLASSDYGLLDYTTHLPRPIYWLIFLGNRLVGTEVFDSAEEIREGSHIYAHSRKDGNPGYTYICINNSKTEKLTAVLPANAEMYLLDAETLRCGEIRINGMVPKLTSDGSMPELQPKTVKQGNVEIPPASVAFLVI